MHEAADDSVEEGFTELMNSRDASLIFSSRIRVVARETASRSSFSRVEGKRRETKGFIPPLVSVSDSSLLRGILREPGLDEVEHRCWRS